MLQAIGFDLDGTLWDSTDTKTDILKKILAGSGLNAPTAQQLRAVTGLSAVEIVRHLYPNIDIKNTASLLEKYKQMQNKYLSEHGGKLYDKAEDTLAKLYEKYKLFIVSHCADGYIECFLTAHNLWKYFCDYECIGRTGLAKGENIKLVMRRNNITSAIYIGDTQGDYEATKAANIPFIHAAYGFGNVDADVPKIEKICDLLDMNLDFFCQ